MGDGNLIFWLISGSVFGAVALVTVVLGNWAGNRGTVTRRLAGARGGDMAAGPSSGRLALPKFATALAADGSGSTNALRQQLVLSGYFSPDAPAIYSLIRLAAGIALPIVAYFVVVQTNPGLAAPAKFALLAASLLVGFYGPEAWIKRRQRILQEDYRIAFPDLLDLLVVALDAGLSVEAAIERVTYEMATGHRALAANLAIMNAEMRAGRSTVDALYGLSERLGIDEARSFVVLLRQSLDLGSNVVDALKVYSGEMREKRMSRAEEKAMALPVKMVLPLGMFIFPTILLLVLTPVMIKLAKVFAAN